MIMSTLEAMISDKMSFERNRDTTEGTKEFNLRKINGCCRKSYILHKSDSESKHIWTNGLDHDHSNSGDKESREKEWGINEVTKREIEKLFTSGVTGAKRIIYALRKKMDERDELNFVPGLIEPQPAQINNYVNNSLKTKTVKPKFSYADLAKWVDEHSSVPDDEHEPFVVDSYIDVNDTIPKASIVRVAISTKYLIGLAKKRIHICADTTWKTNWQGMCIILFA